MQAGAGPSCLPGLDPKGGTVRSLGQVGNHLAGVYGVRQSDPQRSRFDSACADPDSSETFALICLAVRWLPRTQTFPERLPQRRKAGIIPYASRHTELSPTR